ncbi:MAG: hypothetical protein EXR11_12045 [Rhodospirillaceae bacterium]|nr:hypothetical protein [Rhodospirillaceae bacterium]
MKLLSLSVSLILSGAASAHAQAQAPAAAPAAPPAPPPLTAESNSPVVKASEARMIDIAYWVDASGKYMQARGEEAKNAPKNAAMAHVKVFNLGNGQNMREITLSKGAPFTAPKGGDVLVYVTKGKIDLKLGKVSATVAAGDSYRKIGPQDNIYTCMEDSCVFAETDAPKM